MSGSRFVLSQDSYGSNGRRLSWNPVRVVQLYVRACGDITLIPEMSGCISKAVSSSAQRCSQDRMISLALVIDQNIGLNYPRENCVNRYVGRCYGRSCSIWGSRDVPCFQRITFNKAPSRTLCLCYWSKILVGLKDFVLASRCLVALPTKIYGHCH